MKEKRKEVRKTKHNQRCQFCNSRLKIVKEKPRLLILVCPQCSEFFKYDMFEFGGRLRHFEADEEEYQLAVKKGLIEET